MESQEPRARRYDPDRRDRIIDAALDVIAEQGVAGATHRRIAERADVPLGSMTYHFAGMDELLAEAFTRLAQRIASRFREILDPATNIEEAREAVVELICGGHWATRQNMILSFELYAYAARNPRMRSVMTDWMASSRKALGKHFPDHMTRALDALIEGTTIHNTASENLIPRDEVRDIVRRLTS